MVGFPWIALTTINFAEFPWALAWSIQALFASVTALPYGLWAAAIRVGPQPGGGAGATARALVRAGWAAITFVAFTWAWPAIFPYTPFIGLALAPITLQLADLGGVTLVEALLIAAASLAADALAAVLDRRGHAPPAGPRVSVLLGASAAVAVLIAGYGGWKMAVIDREAAAAPKVAVGVVQPNSPLFWGRRVDEKVRRVREPSAAAQAAGAQLIVWPEAGAYPFRTVRPFQRDFDDPRRKVLQLHSVPTIFGATSGTADKPFGWNTAYALASDGRVTGAFDKNILMPFGERIPLVDPEWAKSKIPTLNHLEAGDGPGRFVIEPAATPARPEPGPPFAVGPLICYEDIQVGFTRAVAGQPGGIELFANLTIDTWFGDTAEPWEHMALAQMRSIEHRIPMVRSVAAGVSAVIDANGRLVAHLPVTDPQTRAETDDVPPPQFLVHDVALARNSAARPTPFARGGWLFPYLCQLLVLVVLGRAWVARRAARR
jgi:apolipoprotein N-acyltransferase